MQKTTIKISNIFAILAAFALLAIAFIAPNSALAKSQPEYVLDYYGIITDNSTLNSMEKQAADASEESGVGVYLMYTNVVEGDSVRECAKNYYKQLGLGEGKNSSGVLFFIAVDDRKMVTVTKGDGVTAFTDNRIAEMEKKEKSYLSDDEFLEAGQKYLDLAEETVEYYAKTGTGMDSTDGTTEDYDYDDEPLTFTQRLGGGAIVGLIAFVIVLIFTRKFLKGQLKSVDTSTEANDYLTHEIKITGSEKHFMGTTVTRVHHSSDSGGGSSCDSGGFGGSSGSSF